MPYLSDLEWELVEPLLPTPNPMGVSEMNQSQSLRRQRRMAAKRTMESKCEASFS